MVTGAVSASLLPPVLPTVPEPHNFHSFVLDAVDKQVRRPRYHPLPHTRDLAGAADQRIIWQAVGGIMDSLGNHVRRSRVIARDVLLRLIQISQSQTGPAQPQA